MHYIFGHTYAYMVNKYVRIFPCSCLLPKVFVNSFVINKIVYLKALKALKAAILNFVLHKEVLKEIVYS